MCVEKKGSDRFAHKTCHCAKSETSKVKLVESHRTQSVRCCGGDQNLDWAEKKKFNKARFINKEKEGKKSHITWFIVILFMYSKAVVFKVFKFNALRSPRSSFFNRMYLHKSSITVWRMRWENAFYSFFTISEAEENISQAKNRVNNSITFVYLERKF